MGKRSNFEKVPRDFYPTPEEAVIPLLPHIRDIQWYIEPCAGNGDLIQHLYDLTGGDIHCSYSCDISPEHPDIEEQDAFNLTQEDVNHSDAIITNPPWDRKILHPMIEHFRQLRPTWLLFDADWMHTKQSSQYIRYCSDIVSVGRVKWIPDSKMTGKDNCCWYKFVDYETETRFHGR